MFGLQSLSVAQFVNYSFIHSVYHSTAQVDWTNNAWGLSNFDDRGEYAQQLMNATTFTLQTYTEFRASGLPTPKLGLVDQSNASM